MDLGVTWEGRCQSLREEIGLNVLLQLESEGTYLGFPPFASSERQSNHVLETIRIVSSPLAVTDEDRCCKILL